MDLIPQVALALFPGVVIIIFIYIVDKYEKEPLNLILVSIFLGIFSALFAWSIINKLTTFVVLDTESLQEQAIHAFVVVSLIEESCKFILIRTVLYTNKNFDEPFDGIVYAVILSMGFATLENLIYVINGGITTGIIRMFTAVPAHALFAIFMGFFLGKAKFLPQKELKYNVLALLIPVIFHGFYDYFLVIYFVPGIWVGAIICLILGVLFSKEAIAIHQEASPFKLNPKVNK
jgi:protease PrsW